MIAAQIGRRPMWRRRQPCILILPHCSASMQLPTAQCRTKETLSYAAAANRPADDSGEFRSQAVERADAVSGASLPRDGGGADGRADPQPSADYQAAGAAAA